MTDYTKTFIKGADISSLHEIEKLGAKFYDNGKCMDLYDILKSYGFNYIRLKLWNDPYETSVDIRGRVIKKAYGAGTNDLPTTISLARRAIEHDMGFLLNFHYSDFWADPGKQTIPKAWRGLDAFGLTNAVYEYTKNTLATLIENNAAPTMVQIGNEITNGLLWPYGKKPEFENIARFVSAGIKAVREALPLVPVMIHLDNGGNNAMYREWFDNYMKYGADFDIIGMSYYPFWHGSLDGLRFNMKDMAERYNKYIIVNEVSMGHTTEDYMVYERLAPDERKGMATKPSLYSKIDYPMTVGGQCDFMKDVMTAIKNVPDDMGRGFFYWEPAWLPVCGSEWANMQALSYTGEKGPGGNEWANQALFDYDGNSLPTLSVIRDFN